MITDVDLMLELLFNFSFYLIIGSFGALLKDLYETLTDKNERIRLSEILIGGACATFICLFLKDKWLSDAGINTMVSICFVLGILGFEIFGNITSISKLKRFIKEVNEIRTRPPDEWNDDSDPPRRGGEFIEQFPEEELEDNSEVEKTSKKKSKKE